MSIKNIHVIKSTKLEDFPNIYIRNRKENKNKNKIKIKKNRECNLLIIYCY